MKQIFNPYTALAALAALMASCSDSDDTYNPGLTFSTTGEVAFEASIENSGSRASMTQTGEARWLADDAIGVSLTDGTTATLPLCGTGDTRRAIFKGTLPQGKTLGEYALYPASATVTAQGELTLTLPDRTDIATTGQCAAMAAKIEGSTRIHFVQLMSYINLSIKEIPDAAVAISLRSDKNLSGAYTATLPQALTQGLTATDGTAALTIILPAKREANLVTSLSIPVGQYNSLTATAVDAQGKDLCTAEILSSYIFADRGAMRQLAVTMPKVTASKPQIEGTILVAGIYWAPGNLQYDASAPGADGFQPNWQLAPEQWSFFNCENMAAVNKAVTFNATDYSHTDHFNWGGIASPFDKEATSSAAAAVGTDISGKMYTSQDCTVPTADFAAARYGDLAFWASKGRWRMPTSKEFQKLVSEASVQYASYKVAEGKYVSGIYFFDPAPGSEPTTSDEVKELTADDLKAGLFLPKSGRRYNSKDFVINVQGTQGVYWASDVITGDDATEPCYGAVLSIQNAVLKYPYWNKAFDAKAGFSIRPVYVE